MSEQNSAPAKPAKPKAAPSLLGSNVLGAVLAVGETAMQLGELVAHAHGLSGLSVDDWNALGDEDREKRLAGVLDGLRAAWRAAQGSHASYAVDPTDPTHVDVRVTQQVVVFPTDTATQGSAPVVLKVGLNHVPRWVADAEIVQDVLEG